MDHATFTGLSAFPLTPLDDRGVREAELVRLVGRLAEAGVDSIGALGSTGSYAYLSRSERALAARLAVEAAGEVPVIVGIGSVRQRDVLRNLEDAEEAGAAGVLLAPVTYQPLSDGEVLGLYEAVAARATVPIVVYDNPATTHVRFSDELHAGIAALDRVASIKIPPTPADPGAATDRVSALRASIPDGVTIGISGDAVGAVGLAAGCDVWYSALAGVLPGPCLAIARAASDGDVPRALELSDRLRPVWELFARHGGSLRVVAAIAERLGLVASDPLPLPVRGLDADGHRAVADALARIGVA